MNKPQVTLYTDGACKGNPGIGGWGVLMQSGAHEKTLCGGEAHTTNNRMELTAVIQGLRTLKRPCQVDIYTDSRYVMQGMTEWLANWQARNWQTAGKKPVKNKDLWQELAAETAKHEITWHWVKGHAGHTGNEIADQLSNQGVLKAQQTILSPTSPTP